MNKRTLLTIGGYVLGLVAVVLLILLALPLVSLGDSHPFDSPLVRGIAVGIVTIGGIGHLTYMLYMQAKREKELASGVAGGGEQGPADDTRVLQERMRDALATLKKASGRKGDYLYDLPWYVIIGPPGAGKTTALINSGLKFPLMKGSSPQKIAGSGGTRYCDWWFTEDAVLIDTAGRYSTHDSDSRADRQSWMSFLQLLKRGRPKQPINGVLVCISIEDILSLDPAEVEQHADAIRARLLELHDVLQVDFPVYAVFTKADLIAGFMEFFGDLNEQGRRTVWGATFQTADKTANMVGEIPAEIDALIARLNQTVVDRLQDEPDATARVQIFGFPSQVASLKQPVYRFLTRIFEPTRYHSNATLRGFYFTSGTQEGTPIDQLIGAMARSFGAQDAGQARYSGQGRSFFLGKLLTDVVFGEAGWVSTDLVQTRRAAILKTASYAALALVTIGLAGAWWWSYSQNVGLINGAQAAIGKVRTDEGPLAKETKVADRDFAKILPGLNELSSLQAGLNKPATTGETFGLAQRPRLENSAKAAYETALQRLLRPRLIYRMEERIRAGLTNPGLLIETLPVYLMLVGKEAAIDRDGIKKWVESDWLQLYPGTPNAKTREELQVHLAAVLKLDPPSGYAELTPDQPLVDEARRSIARMSLVDRAYELLRAQSRLQGGADWSAVRNAGIDAKLVFEAAGGADLSSIRVPFLYTYAGFHDHLVGHLDQVLERIRKEGSLLVDDAERRQFDVQFSTLLYDVLQRYQRDFVNAWRRALGQLRMRPLTSDKPQYGALQAAAGPTSPIEQIIMSIRDETQLNRERAAKVPADGKALPPAPKAPRPDVDAAADAIASVFRAYQLLAEGQRGQRAIDQLLLELSEMHAALTLLNDPSRTPEGQAKFKASLVHIQSTATRFPDLFKSMILTAADAFDSDAGAAMLESLRKTVAELNAQCERLISGKYPFKKTSDVDISLQDFRELFRLNGVIERPYTANFAQLIDTSKPRWTWISTNTVARQMPPALARDFQRASEIRDAFFPQGPPGFSFAAKGVAMSDNVDGVRLEINTGVLTVERSGSNAQPAGQAAPPPVVTFQWPGPIGMSSASVSFQPSGPDTPDPPAKKGVWALFRVLDGATSLTRSGEAVLARFQAGTREATFQLNDTTLPSPFLLPALREFRCPTMAP